VPERILYAPRFKSICFHPSLLPRHRGASAINWAIIQGDVETGVTWFWPDKGIDTGPILLQQRIAIGPNDTTGALYFNTLFPLGIETMCDAIDLIKAGKAPMIAQDEKLATYEPPCRDEHAKVDFRKSARDIYNVIRGCDPQPGAYALMAGRQLRLYDATIENAKPNAPPGTIVSVDDGGMRLALSDAALLIRRVRFDPSTKKVAPSELVGVGELTVSAGLE
jgi:methionyl-tRNA formyltransferase